jgi:hypothetical protein
MHTRIADKLDVKKSILSCSARVPAPRTSDGNSLSHDHLCLYRYPFRDAARLIPEVVNSAQTSESSEIYKSGSPHKVSEEPQSALHEGEGEI